MDQSIMTEWFSWLNLLSSIKQEFESLNLITAYSLIKYFDLLTKVIPKPGGHFQEERFLLRKGNF